MTGSHTTGNKENGSITLTFLAPFLVLTAPCTKKNKKCINLLPACKDSFISIIFLDLQSPTCWVISTITLQARLAQSTP
jgi:hypothetical protein